QVPPASSSERSSVPSVGVPAVHDLASVGIDEPNAWIPGPLKVSVRAMGQLTSTLVERPSGSVAVTTSTGDPAGSSPAGSSTVNVDSPSMAAERVATGADGCGPPSAGGAATFTSRERSVAST